MKKEIDIEFLLIWVYHLQKADVVFDHGIGLHRIEAACDGVIVPGISGCGCVQVEHNGLLGTAIDGGGFDNGALHPDAELVHLEVKKLSPLCKGLIIENARSGSRPDWMPGAKPIIQPMLNGKGKPVMIYDKNKNAVACRIEVVLHHHIIDFCRDMYAEWHRAIASLVDILKGRMQAHEPLYPLAAPHPWSNVAAPLDYGKPLALS